MPVRKRSGRGWIVDIHWTYPDGRKERIKRKSPVNTKRGAEEYERQLRAELLNPTAQNRRGIPTLEAFAEEFLDTYVAANNKPSEQSAKRTVIRLHLLPMLGEKKLHDIGVRDIEHLKSRLLKLGYSPKTINNIVSVLSRMLGYAVDIDLLKSAPRTKPLKIAPQTFTFLEVSEYDSLLCGAQKDPTWYAPILVAGECGLRCGEVLGLKWGDIDVKAQCLNVRRTIWNGHIGSPKGGRERRVPMPKRLATVLRGSRHLKGSWVFCDEAGSPFTKKMAQRAMERACKRAQLRQVGWHALRHTYCSHLAMGGASPRSIQELAGHADIRTTMRYMHLAPTALKEAVSILERHRNGAYAEQRFGENSKVL